jgi:HSP20 family protein
MSKQEIAVKDKQDVRSTTEEEPTRAGRAYLPDVDIYETADGIRLWADMPGVDPKDVRVDLADGVLTIEGHVDVKDYETLAPVYTEYNVGNYLRRFTLSRDIDSDRIDAKMENGVLELDLPKAERAKPRRINIATA